MENKELLKAIEEAYKKVGEEYHAFLWSENTGQAIETQKRFNKLLEWVEQEIETESFTVAYDAPINRTDDYTKGRFSDYLKALQKVAFLEHCKVLLLDDRTSEEGRENIEYTLGKVYGLHYDELLEDYV